MATDGRYGGSGVDKTALCYSHRKDSDRVNTNEFLRGLQQLPNTLRTVTSLGAQVDGVLRELLSRNMETKINVIQHPEKRLRTEQPSNTGSHLPVAFTVRTVN